MGGGGWQDNLVNRYNNPNLFIHTCTFSLGCKDKGNVSFHGVLTFPEISASASTMEYTLADILNLIEHEGGPDGGEESALPISAMIESTSCPLVALKAKGGKLYVEFLQNDSKDDMLIANAISSSRFTIWEWNDYIVNTHEVGA